ncbi:hypothetical protein [Phreatobacter stygius]|uniref:Uncharacterized protein n=1 Tax=Phreatobacter stygius TaxID=1940610 RepID=A0A4D7B3N9_9HYPH|nr:hypothetical protein [Phreatobacter stygius]QCI65653.1 hypothetical protein E8M01_16420 [Phreatobacter stygius]
MTAIIPLREQIAEQRGDIENRERTYPRLVNRGELREAEADRLLQRAKAILSTLVWFQEREHELRTFLAMAPADRAVIVTHGPLVAEMALELARREEIAKAGGARR